MNLKDICEILQNSNLYKKESYINMINNEYNTCNVESFIQYNKIFIYLYNENGIRLLEIIMNKDYYGDINIKEVFISNKTIDGKEIENLKFDIGKNIIIHDNVCFYIKNNQWIEVRFWTLIIELFWESKSNYKEPNEKYLIYNNRYNKFGDFFNWIKSENPTEDEFYSHFRWDLVSNYITLSNDKLLIRTDFEKNRRREIYDEIYINAEFNIITNKIDFLDWKEDSYNYK